MLSGVHYCYPCHTFIFCTFTLVDNNLYFVASAIIYMLIISESVSNFRFSAKLSCLLHIPYSAMYHIDSGSMCVHSCIFFLMPSFLLFPIPNGIPIYFITQARNLESILDSFISFNAHVELPSLPLKSRLLVFPFSLYLLSLFCIGSLLSPMLS